MRNTSPQLPVVLSLAGSDPSGGAGIQADLKTFTAIGVYGGAVITALTCQNTLGVSSCLPLPADFIRQQLNDVLNDLNVTYIKIGMTGSAEIVQAIGDVLDQFSGTVVYDPVLKSSSGDKLFSGDTSKSLEPILKNCSVLTPNSNELEHLTGVTLQDQESALAACKELLHRFPLLRAICLKGGHINEQGGKITDFYIEKKEANKKEFFIVSRAEHPRISTKNSHGTGCTFASAFTAFHLLTDNGQTAFAKTVQFMDDLIAQSSHFTIGHGTGPLMHHLWNKV